MFGGDSVAALTSITTEKNQQDLLINIIAVWRERNVFLQSQAQLRILGNERVEKPRKEAVKRSIVENDQSKRSLHIVGRRIMQMLLGTVRGRSH